MYDSWKRSIAKGVTWFAIRFTTLFVITLIMVEDSMTAGTLTTVFYSIGAVLYVAHERLWNTLNFGRIKNSESNK